MEMREEEEEEEVEKYRGRGCMSFAKMVLYFCMVNNVSGMARISQHFGEIFPFSLTARANVRITMESSQNPARKVEADANTPSKLCSELSSTDFPGALNAI